jgi:hypothetical protein
MSLLLDSLRGPRGRRPAANPTDRIARADAVLATLGYRNKRAPSLAKPLALVVTGVGFTLLIAWWLWA